MPRIEPSFSNPKQNIIPTMSFFQKRKQTQSCFERYILLKKENCGYFNQQVSCKSNDLNLYGTSERKSFNGK